MRKAGPAVLLTLTFVFLSIATLNSKSINYYELHNASHTCLTENSLPPAILVDSAEYFEKFYSGEDVFFCPHLNKHNHILGERLEESAIVWRPYDVLAYDLFLNWYGPLSKPTTIKIDSTEIPGGNYIYDTTEVMNRNWSGVNKIRIRIDSADTRIIVLDSRDLVIDSVKVNGQIADLQEEASEGLLRVDLGSAAQVGDIFYIEIAYRYVRDENWGFWLFNKGLFVGRDQNNKPVYVEERLAYTMSEPVAARYWMPCNDYPHDKASSKITVLVPYGFSVASNGLLTHIGSDSDLVTSTYTWEDDTPITTYLMAVAASKYKHWTDEYTRISNPDEIIDIDYFVWEQDYLNTAIDGSEYNARHSFRNVVSMMEYYSTIFGEYPYDKYGMVAVQPYIFGGMEHQTMTMINRSWLRGWYEGGIAHELVHQWLGDLITCATWNDIWINEGGAVWGDAMWQGDFYGSEYYHWNMYRNKKRYFDYGGMDLPPIYGISINDIFGQYAVLVYQKSSWFYHMMMEMLGEEEFLEALRYILEKHKFTSIETRDFLAAIKEAVPEPPVEWETYFDQWLMQAGHPEYDISASTSVGVPGEYFSTVRVKQLQEGELVPDVFEMPLPLKFFGPDDQVIEKTFLNNEREQTAEFELPFYPDSIMIDTLKVLCRVRNTAVSVREASGSEISGVFPNPVYAGGVAMLRHSLDYPEEVKVDLYDNLGNLIEKIYEGFLQPGIYEFNIRTRDLPAGVYNIVLQEQQGIKTGRLSVLK